MPKDLSFSKVDSMEDFEITSHSLNTKFNYLSKTLAGRYIGNRGYHVQLQLRHDCVKEKDTRCYLIIKGLLSFLSASLCCNSGGGFAMKPGCMCQIINQGVFTRSSCFYMWVCL